MQPERAFDADIDQAKTSIAQMHVFNIDMTRINLAAHILNAKSRVDVSTGIAALERRIAIAFYALEAEMETGNTAAISTAKLAVARQLEQLRIEMHNCPSSRINEILGFS